VSIKAPKGVECGERYLLTLKGGTWGGSCGAPSPGNFPGF